MPDENDPLGAAFGGNAFPESSSGSAAWDSYRSKRAAAGLDLSDLAGTVPAGVIAHPSPSARSNYSARGNATEPAMPPAAPVSHADANAGVLRDTLPVPSMLRLRKPEDAEAALPPQAAERLRQLRERIADARAIIVPLGDEMEELRLDAMRQRQRIAKVEEEIGHEIPHKSSDDDDDDPRLLAERDKLTAIQAKIDRLDARRAEPLRLANSIGHVLDSAERYIIANAGSIVPGPKLKPPAKDTLEIVAERILDLRADLSDVETRPWPSEDVKRRMTAEVDFIASKGRVDVTKSLDFRNQLDWPRSERPITVRGFGKVDERGLPDLYDTRQVSIETAIAVWANRDAIVAKLSAEIDELADDRRALSLEERSAQVARIGGNILAEQRLLAEIIWRDNAHDRWLGDLDVRAILGIDGPAPREA